MIELHPSEKKIGLSFSEEPGTRWGLITVAIVVVIIIAGIAYKYYKTKKAEREQKNNR